MKEDQKNTSYYNNEIDIVELMNSLWKMKKTIISFTLIFAILTGLFSVFVISPIYETKLNIVISMPEKYSTKYGEYTLPITTNYQYIDLINSNDVLISTIKDMGYDTGNVSLEKLKKRIVIEEYDTKLSEVQNSFEVTVSADNPNESLKLAQSLFSNYSEFVDVMTKERAVSYFYNYFKVQVKYLESQLDSNKKILQKNQELLATTPQTITNGDVNFEIQTQLTSDSDYVIPIDTVNPNYIKIENDIVENKQSINGIEETIRINNQNLNELTLEKESLDEYYKIERDEKLDSGVISVVETSIYLPSPPVAPTKKASPSYSINIIIGAVVGGVIGVMVALIKQYWVKEV